jgi:hypothetical protein
MKQATALMLTAEQLRMIASILDGLNASPANQAPAEPGQGVPMLSASIPIEADGEALGLAVDDIGGCYMFEAKVVG